VIGTYLEMFDWRLASYQLIDDSSFCSARQLLIGFQITERYVLPGCLPLFAGPKITTESIIGFFYNFFIAAGIHSGGRELTAILCCSRQEC
jgi:hypothetical protein